MPGDGAANPFTIPGTSRKYSCNAGSAISVVGEDAQLLGGQGWVFLATTFGAGPTSARPTSPLKGHTYLDTTLNALLVYGGPKSGWLHHSTGAMS
jgi:hypothetical protein